MTSWWMRRVTRVLVAAIVLGSMLFSSCTAYVDFPGGTVDVNDDGAFVMFPGGTVEVTHDNVVVDVPGLLLDLTRHGCRHGS